MNRLWQLIGITIFWLGWPLHYLYINGSRRTRVLILCDDEIVITKGWIGGNDWVLPGGGVKAGESYESSAIREVQEETGIKLTPSDLQKISERSAIPEHGLSFYYTAYLVRFSDKPKLTKRKRELSELTWRNWQAVYNDPKSSPNTRDIIAAVLE